MQNLICVGKIVKTHGIKGEVKIRSFTQYPEDIEHYQPLFSKDGKKKFEIVVRSIKNEMLIARVNGVNSCNEAQELSGIELYIPRNILPEAEEDEFYYEDLIGLKVMKENNLFGKIKAVFNHGSDDIIEIILQENNKTNLYSFSKDIFPEINITEGYVTINPPETELVQQEEK